MADDGAADPDLIRRAIMSLPLAAALFVRRGAFLWAADNAGKGGSHTTRVVGKDWGLFVAVFL